MSGGRRQSVKIKRSFGRLPCELRCRVPSGTLSPGAGDSEETRRRAEPHHPSTRNGHGLARPRIPGHSRLAGGDVAHPEAPEHHPIAALKRGAQTFERRLHTELDGPGEQWAQPSQDVPDRRGGQ